MEYLNADLFILSRGLYGSRNWGRNKHQNVDKHLAEGEQSRRVRTLSNFTANSLSVAL